MILRMGEDGRGLKRTKRREIVDSFSHFILSLDDIEEEECVGGAV